MMHTVSFPGYTLSIAEQLPELYSEQCAHAKFVDEIDLSAPDGGLFFLGVAKDGDDWPSLISTQKYAPHQAGFSPCCVVVPETARAFVGAGERLLCYDLESNRRLWIDQADIGFHGWRRSGDFILMAAEVEFAVWTIDGRKLWSTFVEPPWSYDVLGPNVTLNVMGKETNRCLKDGAKC